MLTALLPPTGAHRDLLLLQVPFRLMLTCSPLLPPTGAHHDPLGAPGLCPPLCS